MTPGPASANLSFRLLRQSEPRRLSRKGRLLHFRWAAESLHSSS